MTTYAPQHAACVRCGTTITGTPVTDPEQVSWLGIERADLWCSTDCHDNDSEDYWTRRRTA